MKTIGDNPSMMVPEEVIMSKILHIRNRKVMLDTDLAKLYEVKSFRLREQVKRNNERFPENFMFRLTEEETNFMVSHFAIPSKKHLGGHLPYVFTEHGVLMLGNVLRSERAIKMSIRIIEIFVKMREMMHMYEEVLNRLGKIEVTLFAHDKNLTLIFEYLKQLEQSKQEEVEFKERKRIGFRQGD